MWNEENMVLTQLKRIMSFLLEKAWTGYKCPSDYFFFYWRNRLIHQQQWLKNKNENPYITIIFVDCWWQNSMIKYRVFFTCVFHMFFLWIGVAVLTLVYNYMVIWIGVSVLTLSFTDNKRNCEDCKIHCS